MLVVVPGEEAAQTNALLFEAFEALWKFGPRYFRVLNCASENGLSLDTRGREKLAATPRSTRSSAVFFARMGLPRSECSVSVSGVMPYLPQVSLDQRLGQPGVLGAGDQPPDNAAAEDVEQHVQIEVLPLQRRAQPRYVPAPDLVRRARRELGFRVRRVHELVAPLVQQALGGEHAIEGAHRSEVGAFVEQARPRRVRGAIGKTRAVQRIDDALALAARKSQRRRRPRASSALPTRHAPSIPSGVCSTQSAQRATRRHSRHQFGHRAQDSLPLRSTPYRKLVRFEKKMSTIPLAVPANPRYSKVESVMARW